MKYLFFLLLLPWHVAGQTDSLPVFLPDTSQSDLFVIPESKARLDPEDQWAPDPKKALWMSLAVPGLGQIYNRSWWKAPLVYGGLGVSVWFIKTNNSNYKEFKKAYSESFNPNTENELALRYPNQETLRRIRDIYYKRYQLSIIAVAGVYLINGIEAYVDAHLKNFDVSDDLSFIYSRPNEAMPGWNNPTIYVPYYPIIGIRYSLH